MEPIPAQLPEQQNEGLAMNIDEFIVEPEFPDLYVQENIFNLPVGENPGNNGVFEPEMHGNGGGLPAVEDSVEEEPPEI